MPQDNLSVTRSAVTQADRQAAGQPGPDRSRLRQLSYAQQRLWFLSQLPEVSAAYHMPLAVLLAGPLDSEALARALNALADRHEGLRSRFGAAAGEPVGIVDPPGAGLPLRREDLPPDGGEAGLADLCRAQATAPFDLTAGPLARACLVKLGADRHALLITIHHLICDGWSMGVFTSELSALYAAFAAGQPDPLRPLPTRYADYAAWQRRWLASGVAATQGAYWTQALSGVPALLDLPADRPRPPEQDYRCDVIRFELEPALTLALRELSQQQGGTLFMTLLAAWALVLSRLSGSPDVIIGTPTAGRRRAELNGLIGFFVNTLALRVDLSGDPTGTELLRRVREVTVAALDHQDLPFEQVVELVNPPRSPAYPPLVQVLFSWENDEEGEITLPGVTVTRLRSQYAPAQFELSLELAEVGDRIVGKLGFATARFDSATAARQVTYLTKMLAQLTAGPDQPVGSLVLTDAAERDRLLAASDGGPVETVQLPLLHRLFEAQAASAQNAVAVITPDGSVLRYGELNARANQLARYLRTRGAGPDRLVAICADRSAELITAMLAVLKAGAGYVPVDPAYPAERIGAMLADCEPVVIVTHADARGALSAGLASAGSAEQVSAWPVIDLDDDQGAWAGLPAGDLVVPGFQPHHLAYVIYTSGSTGEPNGVQVEHRQLAAIAAAWVPALGLRPGLVHLQLASPSFDVCTADLVRALCFGGTLVLCPRDLLADEAGLLALIRQHGVNFADFVPAVLNPLVSYLESTGRTLAGFETLICGSDTWSADHARRLRAVTGPSVRILNAYGVTEAAVDSSHYVLPALGPTGAGNLPIGTPLPGVRLYLLADGGEPVPDGVVGEIWIGGAGVARGYLRRPELTAARFLPSPFVAGDRLYRTGDLGLRQPDGVVEFLGRRDFQVKIRGLRVELGEIEAVLTGCPGVLDAVVTGGTPTDDRLVAYYRAGEGAAPEPAELRDRLAATLPSHAVPAAYVRLAAWPVTANGKLDRAALPAPAGPSTAGSAEPTGPLEVTLAALWADVLGVERINRQDDFFALGGHSLAALRLVAKVRRTLGRQISPTAIFAAATLAGFAAAVAAAGQDELPPIPLADRTAPLPASFAQQRLWFLAQLDGASDAYHLTQQWELHGELDEAALAGAWDLLLARHEALRTRFVAIEGTAYQLVDPAGPALRIDDLSAAADLDQQVADRCRAAATEPFDLAAGPLARARLVRLAPSRHALVVTMHHIICDGWSTAVLTRELAAGYAAVVGGRPEPLAPLPVQYGDYAAWQQRWLASGAAAGQGEFWRKALDGAPAELDLPLDRPRPAEQDYRGGRVSFQLDPALTARVRELSRRAGVTLFMTMLTGWALVLSRLSGSPDVVIGTPTASRRRDELTHLIGFFANTLALRIDLSGRPTGAELLRRVREVTLAALDHQDLPFEQVVELTSPARSLSRTPLFQTMLTWQDSVDDELRLPGVTAVPVSAPYPAAKFDLTIALADVGDRITGALDFATAIFDQATASRYLRYLHAIVAQLTDTPELAVGRLTLTDEAERRELLGWARTSADRCPGSITAGFEAAVARRPDAIAVELDGRSLSYRELDAQASKLAHHLRALGVGADRRVACCLHRSPELIIALTAILKTGGGYVPLDPGYPAQRLAFMLADSAPALLLTEAELRDRLPTAPTIPVICVDADADTWADEPACFPAVARHPDQLAYVLYTSGSTGRPKGVAQTWRCADAMISWMLAAVEHNPPPAKVLQFASISFDVSFQEIWSTLCAGATLVLITDERRADLPGLPRFIAEQGVRRAFLPAAVLQQLAVLGNDATTWPLASCELITAGEALAVTDDLRALATRLGGRYLHNHYGPTETHAVTSHSLVVADAATWPTLPPIGRPIPGVLVYLLDDELAPVPAGVVGEVYLGGTGLARGYLGQPGLTADRFRPDPFSGRGERLYRTGDLARFGADGTIDYVGRMDSQVKIRGFRVEPGEVEAVLRQLDGVREAAVLVHGDTQADRYLAGYVAGSLTAEEVRDRARQVLPGYLVPTRWIMVDQLPLTANGKLDRRALPSPADAAGDPPYVPPRTGHEAALASIWAEILRRERVGALDDFFVLGGHSLLATRLVHAINQRLSARLSLRDLFGAPVLADLAAVLASGAGDEAAAYVFPPLVADPENRYQPFPLTDMQEAYWVGLQDGTELGGVGAHGYTELRVPSLDLERFTAALARLIERHDMLRAVFSADGYQRVLPAVPPYRLPVHDLRGLADAEAAAKLTSIRDRMSHRVFDASRWPLFEFEVSLLADETRLHLGIDALIVDVASSQLFERELGLLYASPATELPPVPVSFRDYVLAERALRAAPRYERALRYWRERVIDLRLARPCRSRSHPSRCGGRGSCATNASCLPGNGPHSRRPPTGAVSPRRRCCSRPSPTCSAAGARSRASRSACHCLTGCRCIPASTRSSATSPRWSWSK